MEGLAGVGGIGVGGIGVWAKTGSAAMLNRRATMNRAMRVEGFKLFRPCYMCRKTGERTPYSDFTFRTSETPNFVPDLA